MYAQLLKLLRGLVSKAHPLFTQAHNIAKGLGRGLASSSTRREFLLVSCHDRGLQLSKVEMAPDIPAGA